MVPLFRRFDWLRTTGVGAQLSLGGRGHGAMKTRPGLSPRSPRAETQSVQSLDAMDCRPSSCLAGDVNCENPRLRQTGRCSCRIIRPKHQVPIFVTGVPAIKRPARCFGGSITTPSQTMRFTVCSLTQDRTILNSSVSYLGRVSPDFGGSNSVRP
jgi:hypothetical protein